jgi:hypothetical protein
MTRPSHNVVGAPNLEVLRKTAADLNLLIRPEEENDYLQLITALQTAAESVFQLPGKLFKHERSPR